MSGGGPLVRVADELVEALDVLVGDPGHARRAWPRPGRGYARGDLLLAGGARAASSARLAEWIVAGDGVHQVAAGAAPRDAITHHMLEARAVLRGHGPAVGDLRRGRTTSTPPSPATCTRSRAGTQIAAARRRGDPPLLDREPRRSSTCWSAADRCAIHYHNITPAELLWRWAPRIALECAVGRRRLAELRRAGRGRRAPTRTTTPRELEALGFAPARVLGVMRQAAAARRRARPGRTAAAAGSCSSAGGCRTRPSTTWCWRAPPWPTAGRTTSCWLVGAWTAVPTYDRPLPRSRPRALGVADRVRFVGSVDRRRAGPRATPRRTSFVCLSDHEGFCVPLIEAMAAGLPIVAYASSAVPETLGERGAAAATRSRRRWWRRP